MEEGFTVDAKPWLDATELWGKAMVTMLDPLAAWQAGHNEKADQLLAESNDLQQWARAVRVDPARNSWSSG
ncbi:hypothetical protein [Streptomyces sp. NPDC056227]|uniref:hypothetical protein n=1 Tax=unclassified Streptomyces TaxID=2593676 RepID=UPI0035E19DF8